MSAIFSSDALFRWFMVPTLILFRNATCFRSSLRSMAHTTIVDSMHKQECTLTHMKCVLPIFDLVLPRLEELHWFHLNTSRDVCVLYVVVPQCPESLKESFPLFSGDFLTTFYIYKYYIHVYTCIYIYIYSHMTSY